MLTLQSHVKLMLASLTNKGASKRVRSILSLTFTFVQEVLKLYINKHVSNLNKEFCKQLKKSKLHALKAGRSDFSPPEVDLLFKFFRHIMAGHKVWVHVPVGIKYFPYSVGVLTFSSQFRPSVPLSALPVSFNHDGDGWSQLDHWSVGFNCSWDVWSSCLHLLELLSLLWCCPFVYLYINNTY